MHGKRFHGFDAYRMSTLRSDPALNLGLVESMRSRRRRCLPRKIHHIRLVHSLVSHRFGASSRLKEECDAAHAVVLKELARNGYDPVRIDEAQLSGGNVREEDIQPCFEGLKVDKVRNKYS